MSHFLPLLALMLTSLGAACTIDATGFATDFNSHHEGSIRASTTEAPVGQDGRCQSDISIDPALLRPGNSGQVALGSTECEVVAWLGGPYSVEIHRGMAGERVVRLTYVSGAKIGIYVFANNRLTGIER